MAVHPVGYQLSGLVRDPAAQRQWFAASAAGLITLLPVLLAVDLYIDDLERAMDGRLNWVRVGRPLADTLVEWLNFGRPATAVAPLYTLVSIALLSAVGVACARAYGIRSPFWTAVSSLPLMAQPYGLQVMSYGFDSLFMALALAASVMAALLVNLSRRWPMLLTALAMELVAFNLYPPAANGFLVMCCCLCVAAELDLLDRSLPALSLPRRLIGSAGIYCGAFGAYRLLIALLSEHKLNSYAQSSAELKAFDVSLPLALWRSAVEPLQQLLSDFGRWPVVLPLLLLLISYGCLARQWRSSRLVIVAFAGLGLALLLAPGGLLLLRESFIRHPRVLISFGPLGASLILQLTVLAERVKRPRWRFGALPFIWLMVVFSYAYGHAFAAQARFEQSRLSRIVGAVSVLQAAQPDQLPRYLVVEGTMPRSPVLENTVRKFPLIDRLVPPLLDGDQTFSFSQLRLHGLNLQRRKTKEFGKALPTTCSASAAAICTHEFSLQRVGDSTLVLQLAADPALERSST